MTAAYDYDRDYARFPLTPAERLEAQAEVLEERRLDRERINRWREELQARKQWEALKKQHLDVDFNPWRVITHPRLGGLARAD